MKIINKIYTRLLAVAALSAMVFASCETPLDIEYLDTEEKVVVNAMGNTDENLNLRLTYSRWFLSEKPFKEIDNATVSLLANGQKVDEGALRVDGSTYPAKKYYCFDNYLPKEGDMLKLDIQVPGEEPITAECRVPYKPQVSNFTVKEHNVDDDYSSYKELGISFLLNDNPNEKNYYMLQIYSFDQDYLQYFSITDYLLVETDVAGAIEGDMSVTDNVFLFSDEKINGLNYNINLDLFIDMYSYDNGGLQFRLIAIAEALYYYMQSLELMTDDMQEVFGEPVQIYNNISNGIGIFAISSTTTEHVVAN
jgi:hypothetical protein